MDNGLGIKWKPWGLLAVASASMWGGGHVMPLFGKPTMVWDVVWFVATIGFALLSFGKKIYPKENSPEIPQV